MHVVESLAIRNQYHMQVALADGGQSKIVGILQSRQITIKVWVSPKWKKSTQKRTKKNYRTKKNTLKRIYTL